jgi:endonuclease/exonuclease/phosphatase family metal-dependent hydrolase
MAGTGRLGRSRAVRFRHTRLNEMVVEGWSPYPPDESLRSQLATMLSAYSIRCHTADELYPTPLPPRLIQQTLIDHVCTNFGQVRSVETWSGIDGKSPRLSDHPGVIVTLAE